MLASISAIIASLNRSFLSPSSALPSYIKKEEKREKKTEQLTPISNKVTNIHPKKEKKATNNNNKMNKQIQ